MTTTLTTPGLTGTQWITRLEKGNYNISSYAKQLLLSPDFISSKTTCEIVIVKCSDVGKEYPTTKEIRAYAKAQGYLTPSPELACIIRETISDEEIKEMGLWYIVAMHEPIKNSVGDPSLLDSYRADDGRWLSANYGRPDDMWSDCGGFAFVVPQVGTLKSDTQTSSDPMSLDLETKTFTHYPLQDTINL